MELIEITPKDHPIGRKSEYPFTECPTVLLRITSNDGISLSVRFYIEKKWILKLQKSLQHQSPQFTYNTDNRTKIIRVDDDLCITTEHQVVTLSGQIWLNRLKTIVDQIISNME